VYFCRVSLGAEWDGLLEQGWGEARIRVVLEEAERADRAAQLLGPLQPYRAGPKELTFRVVGKSDSVRRLLERLDEERIHGRLELISSDPIVERAREAPVPTLREQWEAALATLPADWSDLLAEVELTSSDYFEKAVLNMVPLNPKRVGDRVAVRFRAARKFGYGAPPKMVARCLSRCDEDGMHGTVRMLRVLSGSRPVGTQGPIWQIDGLTV
jgi:hypothetical protein